MPTKGWPDFTLPNDSHSIICWLWFAGWHPWLRLAAFQCPMKRRKRPASGQQQLLNQRRMPRLRSVSSNRNSRRVTVNHINFYIYILIRRLYKCVLRYKQPKGGKPFLLPVWRSGSLAESVRSTKTVAFFKYSLKTHLFNMAF